MSATKDAPRSLFSRLIPRKLRTLSSEDIAICRRVLSYAQPYRARILGALFVGMLAGALTAINLVALIPVLTILFEDPNTYGTRAESTRAKIVELDAQIAQSESILKSTGLRFDRLKSNVDLAWKEWVRNKKEDAIYMMAFLLVIAQILKNILDFISKYALQKSFYLAVVRMRTDLYTRCIELDLRQYLRFSSGDLLSRLNNDIRAVRQVFTTLVGDIVLAPFAIFALMIVLFFLNWRMTLVVFVGMPLIVVPIAALGKMLRTMGKKDEEEDSRLLGYTQEVMHGLAVVKAFRGEQRETNRFRNLSREIARRQIKREKFRLYGDPAVEIFASIAMAGVICLGAYLVLKSSTAGMSPAAFIIYLGILTRFYPPIKRISGTFVKLQKALANAERIFEVLDTKPEIAEKTGAIAMGPFQSDICFENVTFRYSKDRLPALVDFSLEIRKGRKIALVGETGAGKSTVIRLLPRLYDVDAGHIMIDGVDVRDLTISSLRGQVAIVTQDPVLFNDTIHNNIAYARPDASEEDILRAATDAQVMEFVQDLPQKLQTIVGERGGQLSGGQKQRITIARALLANAPILILDEATSALDNVSEALVQEAIEKAVKDRTVIMIAHRLSTIRQADEIIVMEDGRIIERGTHEELMGATGKYHTLVMRPSQTGSRAE